MRPIHIALAWTLILLGFAALASTFLFAVFEVRWWMPVGPDDEARDLLLFGLHGFSLIAGVTGAAYVLNGD